jgi:hypothetical protein
MYVDPFRSNEGPSGSSTYPKDKGSSRYIIKPSHKSRTFPFKYTKTNLSKIN